MPARGGETAEGIVTQKGPWDSAPPGHITAAYKHNLPSVEKINGTKTRIDNESLPCPRTRSRAALARNRSLCIHTKVIQVSRNLSNVIEFFPSEEYDQWKTCNVVISEQDTKYGVE